MNTDKIKEAVETVVERYKTADPFVIADKLNIDVEWTPLFGKRPFAKTTYDDDEPVVMMNERIKYLPSRYYTGIRFGHSKLEHESDVFAAALLGVLYIEENDRYPETLNELVSSYGIPEE